MILAHYRKHAGLSQARLAELLTQAGFPATQALVSQWESGQVQLSAERCLQLEQVTQAGVTRFELRPDLFGPAPGGPESPAAAEAESARAA